MGASITKQTRLTSELSQFADKYGVIPLQSINCNKFKITFGDFDYTGRGPTENLAKERAIVKALKHLNSLPIPEKPEYAEFHELALKHGLTPLCAIDGNNAKIKLGNFIAEDKGPNQRVAVQKAVSKALKYLRACEIEQTTPISESQEFFELTEKDRLTFLRSKISSNAEINLEDKSELSKFAEKYGVIPLQSVTGNKFKITFGDFDYTGRGPTENLAKERAIVKALKHLNSLPIPEKPEYAEFHELALKHGLTPLCAIDGNNAKIKLGNFIAEEKGPDQRVAVQKAVSKALKYLRACEIEQTTPTSESQEFFELTEEHRLTFLRSIISDNAEINLGDFFAKAQRPPTPDSMRQADTSPDGLMENESAAGLPTSSHCLSTQPEPSNEDDSRASKDTDRHSNTISESSPAKETKTEDESPNGPIENEISTGSSTSSHCLSTQPEPSNEDDSKTFKETDRHSNTISESSLAKETKTEGESPNGPIENESIAGSSLTCSKSTRCLPESSISCAPSVEGKALNITGLADDATTTTTDANKNTEAMEVSTPTASTQEQTSSGSESRWEENPTPLEAVICVPIDQFMTSEDMDENITNTQEIHKEVQHNNHPMKKTRAYAFVIRSQIRFPNEFQLTLKEKQEILREAVQDLTQEFQSPELLKEAAVKPGDPKLLNTLTKKVSERYKILERQKRTERYLAERNTHH